MKNTAFINQKEFAFLEGETILTYIRRIKGENYIPTLCDSPMLKPFGSCRLCTVEVRNGTQNKTVAACHTPVTAGMKIYPDTEEIQRLKKNIVELVLTDHPLDCLTCEANGDCQLQSVAAQVGISNVRYPEGKNHQDHKKDVSHTFLRSDFSKCINCYQCVRVCDEIQGKFVLDMAGRGFDSYIIKGLETNFAESDCVSCGACAQVCPTNAISDIFRSQMRNATKTVRTVCTYCGVGCNIDIAVRDNEILGISAPTDAEVNQGHLCVKGRYAFRFYDHPDRLRSPLIRKNGKLEAVSWDEAYDFIAEKLNTLREKYGPDCIAGISSARYTSEENYLMQKFIRVVVGTNNIDGCARICHAPTATGMQRTFGMGAATNSIKDIEYTDCMLVVGANPTSAHPVTGAKIKQAAIKGKKLIVIDPRKTELAKIADYHLQLKPGSNIAVLNMMMHYILKEGLEDKHFIKDRTEGFEELRKNLMQLDLDKMEKVSGINRKLAQEAAIAYASAPNAMSFHGLGVTEHYQGTFGVMLIADLAMITGNIGRRGVGVNPLRGQNNVQGAADMGIQPNQGSGYIDMSNPDLRKNFERIYQHPMPSGPGMTIPKMFEAASEGKLKALWIVGEDVMQTEPHTSKTREALENLDLVVLQELVYTETAKYADVILPASSFLEKSGTFTNGERRVQRVNKVIDPLPGTKPDGQILVEMMNKMGYPQGEYKADKILEEIAQVVPFFKGITWERLGKNGLQWPVDENGTPTEVLHTESFKFGKGRLFFVDYEESKELKENSKNYPLILTTNRMLEHYNSGSMTRRSGLRDLVNEDVLLVSKKDAKDRKLRDGDEVNLKSARGSTRIRVRVSDQVQPGILSSTFHFPEILINRITSDVMDTEADCPEYKVVAVDLEKTGL